MFRQVTSNKSSIGSKIIQDPAVYPLIGGLAPKISQDGQYILTTFWNDDQYRFTNASLINIRTESVVRSYTLPTGGRPHIRGNSKYVAITAPNENVQRGRVYIYDISSGAQVRVIENPRQTFSDQFGAEGASFSANGERVAIGSASYYNDAGSARQGRVHIFDVSTGNLIRTIIDPATGFRSFGAGVVLSSDGSLVAFTSDTNSYVHNVDTGALVATIAEPPSNADAPNISLSGDGRVLFINRTKYSGVDGSLLVRYSTDTAFGAGNFMSSDGSTVVICSTTNYKLFRGSNTTPVEEGDIAYPQFYAQTGLATLSGDGSMLVIQGVGELFIPPATFEQRKEIVFKEY